MNYDKIETWMRNSYNNIAQQYRSTDEADALGGDHQRICRTLSSICCSFEKPISVLDVGCGTGRYFHCLRNVENLLGIDVSPSMLEAARTPVRAEECTAQNVRLEIANAYTTNFPAGSFEFIFSIGVFGNGCGVTQDLCDKFYQWLKPGGCVFFDATDISWLPFHHRARLQLRQSVYRMLPRDMQDKWDQRTGWLPFFCTSQKELTRMLKKSNFVNVDVQIQAANLTLGPGKKLECKAWKPA